MSVTLLTVGSVVVFSSDPETTSSAFPVGEKLAVVHVFVAEVLAIVARLLDGVGISYHPKSGHGQRHGAMLQYHGDPSGVAVIVAPMVGTGVAVSVGKGVTLGVAVTPGTVAVGVAVSVETAVSVGVGVIVGVLLGDGVPVGVGVGAGWAKYHGAM